MTWSLSASGHTNAPEGAGNWEEAEQKLHDELAAVLAKPEYGCGQSSFSGNYVTSNCLHIPQDDPAVEHEHEHHPQPHAGHGHHGGYGTGAGEG